MIINLQAGTNQAETLYTALEYYKERLEEIALDDEPYEELEQEIANCDYLLDQLTNGKFEVTIP